MKTFLLVVFFVVTLGLGIVIYLAYQKYGSAAAIGQAIDSKVTEFKTEFNNQMATKKILDSRREVLIDLTTDQIAKAHEAEAKLVAESLQNKEVK